MYDLTGASLSRGRRAGMTQPARSRDPDGASASRHGCIGGAWLSHLPVFAKKERCELCPHARPVTQS
ncbi:hypothetical protein ASE85_19860 [Sphingobium sp. Leaf26]|nr:hypothetical protein ASE85_19860 [Sphingobium sp. Leaf26]